MDLIEVKNHLQKSMDAFDDIEEKSIAIEQKLELMNSMSRKGNQFVFQIQMVNVKMVHGVFMALQGINELLDKQPVTIANLENINVSFDEAVQNLEVNLIRNALKENKTQADAARQLKIKRSRLVERIRKYKDMGVNVE